MNSETLSNTFKTENAAQTQELAARLAAHMRGGEIIFLSGPIGAGKTTFVQGMARYWKMKRPVSASFSIMRQYRGGGFRMVHIDLFRLCEDEIYNLGIDSILEDPRAVIVAEWPAPMASVIAPDRLEIEINLLHGDGRELVFRAGGEKSRKLLEALG